MDRAPPGTTLLARLLGLNPNKDVPNTSSWGVFHSGCTHFGLTAWAPSFPQQDQARVRLSWSCQRLKQRLQLLAWAVFWAHCFIAQAWPLAVGLEGSSLVPKICLSENLTYRSCLYVNCESVFRSAPLEWTLVCNNWIWNFLGSFVVLVFTEMVLYVWSTLGSYNSPWENGEPMTSMSTWASFEGTAMFWCFWHS